MLKCMDEPVKTYPNLPCISNEEKNAMWLSGERRTCEELFSMEVCILQCPACAWMEFFQLTDIRTEEPWHCIPSKSHRFGFHPHSYPPKTLITCYGYWSASSTIPVLSYIYSIPWNSAESRWQMCTTTTTKVTSHPEISWEKQKLARGKKRLYDKAEP